MAEPLPDGFVDTGTILYLYYAGSMRVQARLDTGSGANRTNINEWIVDAEGDSVQSMSCPDPPGYYRDGTFRVKLMGPLGVTPTEVETFTFECVPYETAYWSQWYHYTGVEGPYRLGVRLNISSPDPRLVFAQRDLELQYSWFADEDTHLSESLGSLSLTRWEVPGGGLEGDHPTPGMTPVSAGVVGALGFGCDTATGGGAQFTGLALNGEPLDTAGLNDGVIRGDGGGAAHSISAGIGGGQAKPGLVFTEDIDITRFGGGSTGATVRDADGNAHTVPYQGTTITVHNTWNPLSTVSGSRSFTIDSVWAAAQDPPFRSDDLLVPLMQSPKTRDGHTYTPVSITIPFELDLQRPDGSTKPSHWVSADSKIDVDDTTDPVVTTITVHMSGGSISRTLTSAWRDRVGLGAGGTGNPAFDFTNYQYTKRGSGEDVYAYDLWTQMELDIEAPTSATLTVQLDGNYLDIEDPHVTSGTERKAGYVAALTPFSYTYSLPITFGRKTYYVDLCFPTNATAPVYPSRVDKITITGFVPDSSNYILHEWELEARSGAYLKIDFGPPVRRGDYSAVMIAIDGSFGLGNLPDQANKADEIGAYGGGLRYVTPLTGSDSLLVLDEQLSLADFVTHLNNIEGINATRDASVSDAYLKDSFGNSVGGEYAQVIRPVVPHYFLTPGVPYQPPCSVQCARVVLCNAIPFTIYSRWNAGYGAIEALVPSLDGGRAPAGIALTAGYGSEGVTDVFGYVVVSPVPADGPGSTLTYSLEGA